MQMPSASYGRGGGNYTKRPKSLDINNSALKQSEKVSLLKKIAHAFPGGQSKKSRPSALSQPTTPLVNNPWEIYAGPISPTSMNETPIPPTVPSLPVKAPLYASVLDISRRNGNPAINLNTLTPSSSEDESSVGFERDASPASSTDILPFSSPRILTDTESTVVNDVVFPTSPSFRNFEVPPLPPTRSMRMRSMSDAPRNVRFQSASNRPSASKDLKTLAALEGRSSDKLKGYSEKHALSEDDRGYKRGRRITLGTTTARGHNFRRPISLLTSSEDSRSLTQPFTYPHNCEESKKPAPITDPFNNLFASCALSLCLLIILAAGKDILYVVALLPVLMALGKHFLDFDKLGLYAPLTGKSLESLISL